MGSGHCGGSVGGLCKQYICLRGECLLCKLVMYALARSCKAEMGAEGGRPGASACGEGKVAHAGQANYAGCRYVGVHPTHYFASAIADRSGRRCPLPPKLDSRNRGGGVLRASDLLVLPSNNLYHDFWRQVIAAHDTRSMAMRYQGLE